MTKYFTFLIAIFFVLNAHAAFCKKDLLTPITMDDDWHKKEELRLVNEDELIKKFSKYITKKHKPLVAEKYHCVKGEDCDLVKNCQMEREVRNLHEVEYSIATDSGFIIAKSYCSTIGKCVGYNDFFHTSKVTAAEDRLIDVKNDHAIFYHYFYSAKNKSFEPPFNITNFHNGSELYLNDTPHFSPDNKFILEVRSVPESTSDKELLSDFPRGFNINIYELNNLGEYVNVESSDFLSRNPSCGDTPYFHSWQNDHAARISMLPPQYANHGRKVILSYDKKLKKWGCSEDLFPEVKCESYLPNSTRFSSNLSKEQIDCF